MITINDAKRLIKRIILANITTDKKDLALTPLISGKHGIGKSSMIKSIADDLGGVCITIEGGTLKEGEITGLPYQYEDKDGNIKFRFLPYYAIDRIQNEEKKLFLEKNKGLKEGDCLLGDENKYSDNNISIYDKLELLKTKKIRPVIIFIDEINRTENSVYKELMNILLTRTVNGYKFPWWVFFVGAMNPSTQNSVYMTNEMDPAQLDRFIKLKIKDNTKEWLNYANETKMSESIISFISNNPKLLSVDDKTLDDDEKPTPSPRGWDMVDTLLKSVEYLQDFFTEKENSYSVINKDLKELISAKLGVSAAMMFCATLDNVNKLVSAEEIVKSTDGLKNLLPKIIKLSSAKKLQVCTNIIEYLKNNIDFLTLSKSNLLNTKNNISKFVETLEPSTKLLFAQNIASTTSIDGTNLLDVLSDSLGEDLVGLLDLSDRTKQIIEES